MKPPRQQRAMKLRNLKFESGLRFAAQPKGGQGQATGRDLLQLDDCGAIEAPPSVGRKGDAVLL